MGEFDRPSGLALAGAMVCVRSDVERKRPPHGRTAGGHDLYAAEQTARVYRRLLAICRLGTSAGFPMIADATFLARGHRQQFASLAARQVVSFSIVVCNADLATLRERIAARTGQGRDPSEAGLHRCWRCNAAPRSHWEAMNGDMWCVLATQRQPNDSDQVTRPTRAKAWNPDD